MNAYNSEGMITDSETLSRICASYEASESIALDTEYVRESTYYPQPSLVQISDGNTYALLDVIMLRDLYPLKELLSAPITKIIHAFEQDLAVLEYMGCPITSALFDPQLAAAFLGNGYKIGYQDLVKKYLGIRLEKGYARSDWLTRPLSDAQINYAIEDVIYLHDIRSALTEHLQQAGKLDWFEEESVRALADYRTYIYEGSMPKIVGEGKLVSARQRTRLKQLVEWREEKAREANLPRRWLVKDKHLIEVAQNRMSLEELVYLCVANCENTVATDVDELKEYLSVGKHEGYEINILSGKDKKLIEEIRRSVAQAAKEYEVEKSLIASHRQITEFVRDKENRATMALSCGWRHQIIKQSLVD